jgi:hypothetical protein
VKKYLLFLVVVLLISCNKEDQDDKPLNYVLFFTSSCEDRFVFLCVSADEFARIRKIYEENQNSSYSDCLPIRVTNLNGIVYNGFLRGYSVTGKEIDCID